VEFYLGQLSQKLSILLFHALLPLFMG
jgi:hypothetical protein